MLQVFELYAGIRMNSLLSDVRQKPGYVGRPKINHFFQKLYFPSNKSQRDQYNRTKIRRMKGLRKWNFLSALEIEYRREEQEIRVEMGYSNSNKGE